MQRQKKEARIKVLRRKFARLWRELDERQRRLWAAGEALELGYGGVMCVAEATGLARSTIQQGVKDLRRPGRKPKHRRIRRVGGGRKKLVSKHPRLPMALDQLIEPTTRGDPARSLRWTTKSTRTLADKLQGQGFQISHQQVRRMLISNGYSLQSNRKTVEGRQHPDRNAQFEYIAKQVRSACRRKQPVISVDTKKKELVGRYKNDGHEWRRRGDPERVLVHDFPDPKVGKAIPYGVYDIAANNGWVSVGIDHDTAQFAAASIGRWWDRMGSGAYPEATELLITADAGGSNSYRTRGWKIFLQDLANKTGLRLKVLHFPPGTSKWNKIEHRMFCHISQNWRGRPLESYRAVVSLISNTRTRTGLSIKSALDRGLYPTGLKVTDEQMARVLLKPASFHGEWNYIVSPRPP